VIVVTEVVPVVVLKSQSMKNYKILLADKPENLWYTVRKGNNTEEI